MSAFTPVHGIEYVEPGDNIQDLPTTYQASMSAIDLKLPPPGTVVQYAGDDEPEGWLIPNGRAVSRTQYSRLFAVIGTKFGNGDGATTFNLPNIRGRVPVMLDAEQTEFAEIGKTGGAKSVTLTIDQIPAHQHNMNTRDYDFGSNPLSGSWNVALGSHNTTHRENGSRTNNTGGGQAHNNLQPYIVLNYLIKY